MVGRVVGDFVVVLFVFGLVVEDNIFDLFVDGGVVLGDGGIGEGGILVVVIGDDFGLGVE